MGLFVRRTHSIAELEVSPAAYDEIAGKLREAGYDHAFVDGLISLRGVGLLRGAEPPPHPQHRPIAPAPARQPKAKC